MRKRRGSTPSPDTDTGNQSVVQSGFIFDTICTGSSDHEAFVREAVNKLNIVHKLITIDSSSTAEGPKAQFFFFSMVFMTVVH